MTRRERVGLVDMGLKLEQEQEGKAINHSGVYRVGLGVWGLVPVDHQRGLAC